jgi:hypothetical protein
MTSNTHGSVYLQSKTTAALFPVEKIDVYVQMHFTKIYSNYYQ